MQLMGKPFDEKTLLQTAHVYQQNTPWHLKKPAI
jgi:aspartyl-tRNA(Asn)/glutamyl-tRNA(Gln) amidotransferase subunit A